MFCAASFLTASPSEIVTSPGKGTVPALFSAASLWLAQHPARRRPSVGMKGMKEHVGPLALLSLATVGLVFQRETGDAPNSI